jgi:hypothetical protein
MQASVPEGQVHLLLLLLPPPLQQPRQLRSHQETALSETALLRLLLAASKAGEGLVPCSLIPQQQQHQGLSAQQKQG